MHEIICPHCKKAFKIDEAGYADIVKQVRDSEFESQIHDRLEIAEREKQTAIELAQQKTAAELQKAASEKDAEIQALKSKLELTESAKQLAVSDALKALEKERDGLANTLEQVKQQATAAAQLAQAQMGQKLQETASEKDALIAQLQAQIQSTQVSQQLQITKAVSLVEQERDKLKFNLEQAELQKRVAEQSLKDRYEQQIKDRDDAIERLKDLKAKLSTKMVGETLEQHCEVEFNRIRATAFPYAYFEKDNDARSGSKGDYIFKDADPAGTEIVSIIITLLMVVFMYISFKPVNTRGVGRCHKAMCTHENLTKVCTKLLNRVHKFCVHMHKFWSLFSSFHYVSTGASPACWQTAHATQERALPNSALY